MFKRIGLTTAILLAAGWVLLHRDRTPRAVVAAVPLPHASQTAGNPEQSEQLAAAPADPLFPDNPVPVQVFQILPPDHLPPAVEAARKQRHDQASAMTWSGPTLDQLHPDSTFQLRLPDLPGMAEAKVSQRIASSEGISWFGSIRLPNAQEGQWTMTRSADGKHLFGAIQSATGVYAIEGKDGGGWIFNQQQNFNRGEAQGKQDYVPASQ